MTTLTQLTLKEIANLILVILFWLTPTIYGLGTLIYFIVQFKTKNTKNKKISITLLGFNFLNCLWAWMSLFLFIMLLWGAPVTETFIWIGLIIQGFFSYIIPFINLTLYLHTAERIPHPNKVWVE